MLKKRITLNISLEFHPISILIHLAVNTVGRFHFQPATLHLIRAPAFYIFTFINLTAIIGGQICNHPWLTKSLNEAAAAAAVKAAPICCTAHGGFLYFLVTVLQDVKQQSKSYHRDIFPLQYE